MTLTAVINPVVPLNLLFPHQRVICPHSRLSAKYRIVTHNFTNNKFYYPKVSVMYGVEHTLSLFFNDVSKIPGLNQIITSHKAIYKLFGSGIYHKPQSIFKSK